MIENQNGKTEEQKSVCIRLEYKRFKTFGYSFRRPFVAKQSG